MDLSKKSIDIIGERLAKQIDEKMIYRDLPISIKYFRECAKHFIEFIDNKSS